MITKTLVISLSFCALEACSESDGRKCSTDQDCLIPEEICHPVMHTCQPVPSCEVCAGEESDERVETEGGEGVDAGTPEDEHEAPSDGGVGGENIAPDGASDVSDSSGDSTAENADDWEAFDGGQDDSTFGLYLNPDTLSDTNACESYNQQIIMSAFGGTPPYSYNCAGSGVEGLTARISGTSCLVNGTPWTSGVYHIDFTVNDVNGLHVSRAMELRVKLTNPPSGGSATDITQTGHLPNYLAHQLVAPFSDGIPGAAYYLFSTDQSYLKVSINLEAEIDSSGDYSNGLDLLASDSGLPCCSSERRTLVGRSNEVIIITNRDASGQLQPISPRTFYVTVCNFPDDPFQIGIPGRFRISWAGYTQ